LHDLRKRVRRLRYAVDFVEPLYGKELRQWRRRLVALQDTLGDYQDAEVNGTLLHDLAASEPALSKQAVFALGMVAERNRALSEQLREEVRPNYNAVSGAVWRKVRSTIEKAAPKR
jgi:CHAD domain-containing protein